MRDGDMGRRRRRGIEVAEGIVFDFLCAAVKHEGQRTSPCYQQRMIPVLDSKENLVDYITREGLFTNRVNTSAGDIYIFLLLLDTYKTPSQ